jgi:hypothetical protein
MVSHLFYYFVEYFFNHDISRKVPDGYILPAGRRWPTIVVEVGYTEKYEDLY